MEILRGEASSTHIGDRGVKAPFGINGGKESQKNELKYYLCGREFIPPRVSKVVGVKMQKGDKIIVRTPGGGGYGNPFERDIDLVLKDVKMRYITADSAETDYGVAVVKKDNVLQVDHERTAQLRGIKSTR
ncbi:hydantoinase B/oxoprolinase family protein [Chloroflexota bacterium]